MDEGKYFLRNKSKYAEVSKAVFYYSYAHTVASAGLIVAVIGMAFVNEAVKIIRAYK